MAKKKKISPSRKEKESRPPVVAVLGHVDHGKTTLLDKIRQTNVVASEAGGITQHIGAYRVEVKSQKSKPKAITFIDTPGHAAFSQMRSRGAKVADLVVLVVAASEGVKPQTLESLKYIQAAKVPYLVALTKVDLADVNLNASKKNLAENGILVEGYGGDIVAVPVSGKTGQGINDLLEMILLMAEMNQLKGRSDNPLQGVIIESRLDHQRGPLATILVRDGHLKIGEEVTAEGESAKIKAMFNERGKRVSRADPSMPVEVLGFKKAPSVGVKVERAGKEVVGEKLAEPKPKKLPEEEAEGPEGERLKIILKADVRGTLEAVKHSLPGEVEIISADVGEVNSSDILLAQDTGAEIIAFNVSLPGAVKKLAATEKVKVKSYQIIYELLEEIEKRVLKILEPTIDEKILGRAKILKEFDIKGEKIAGCQVVEGEVKKEDQFHLQRGETVIGDCRFKSMKTGKEDLSNAKKGEEFGSVLSPSLDFQKGDMLVSFRQVEEP